MSNNSEYSAIVPSCPSCEALIGCRPRWGSPSVYFAGMQLSCENAGNITNYKCLRADNGTMHWQPSICVQEPVPHDKTEAALWGSKLMLGIFITVIGLVVAAIIYGILFCIFYVCSMDRGKYDVEKATEHGTVSTGTDTLSRRSKKNEACKFMEFLEPPQPGHVHELVSNGLVLPPMPQSPQSKDLDTQSLLMANSLYQALSETSQCLSHSHLAKLSGEPRELDHLLILESTYGEEEDQEDIYTADTTELQPRLPRI